jgi:hypothetical protein
MVLGLPASTFFWVIGVWIIAAIGALVYGMTYRDSDNWWTFEDIISKFRHNKR